MSTTYLLNDSAAERERLELQARVWEPAAEALLDQIGVQPGWRCLDLACGPTGILEPLARRAGPAGRVVGLDNDPVQLAAARRLIERARLTNVELVAGDAYRTGLPAAAFDLTHVRFLFAPAGRDADLLAEICRLTRAGGVVAVQEPDAASWQCYPAHPAWERLKTAILVAFARGGGDFNAGRRTYGLLRRAGLTDVQVRAAVLALPPGHPYRRLPVQFAASLRQRILDAGLLISGRREYFCFAYGRLDRGWSLPLANGKPSRRPDIRTWQGAVARVGAPAAARPQRPRRSR